MSADPIVSEENAAREPAFAVPIGWYRELREAWEAFASPRGREGAPAVRVEFAASGATIEYVGRDGETGRVATGADDDGQSFSAALPQACARAGTRDVAIVLPSREVLRPRVKLPFVARRAIRAMLGFELERLTPLPLNELYFDFQIAARDRRAGRTEVDLRIVKRDLADSAVAAIHRSGGRVSSILFEADGRAADWRHFPVDRLALLRAHWQRRGLAWLAALSLVLAIAIVAGAYVRGMEVLSAIEDHIEAQQLDMVQVEHVRRSLADARAQIAFVSEKKSAQPLLLSTLSALSEVLPDGTWLTDLSLQGRKAHAQGYSHSASDLIALIDRSPRFANAQFNAPVVQSSNKLDRFDIIFDIRPGAP